MFELAGTIEDKLTKLKGSSIKQNEN